MAARGRAARLTTGDYRLTTDQPHYQATRTPTRTTRGASSELIVFALLAFWPPRSDSVVLPLNRLNTSRLGVIFSLPSTAIGRSTLKSTVWKFGRRASPRGSR